MKRIKFLIVSVLVLLFGSTSIVAQQDPQFTQYLDNMLFVNLAYAGSNEVLNLTAMHREQWMGFAGSPRSTTFSAHSPLPYKSLGVGITGVNDRVGPFNQSMLYADVSYTLRFKNHQGKLSFGLKGGLNFIALNANELAKENPNDPKVSLQTLNTINPNFGFGMYYHTPAFFVGVSTPKIIQKGYDGISETNREQRHYFGTVGGIIELADKWKLRPSALAKITEGSPLSLDLTLATIFDDKFWLGANYRLLSGIGVFAQFQIIPQLKVGLASDFGLQKMREYNQGTFEVLVSYDFNFMKGGVFSPRYF